jgi:hypothetical protein
MVRRPCGLASEACARDSTTPPLQPAWAGAGCLLNLQSPRFSLRSCPLPCRLTVRAQALEAVSTLAFWWHDAGRCALGGFPLLHLCMFPFLPFFFFSWFHAFIFYLRPLSRPLTNPSFPPPARQIPPRALRRPTASFRQPPSTFALQSADSDEKEDPRREPARGRGGGRVRRRAV